MLNYLNKRLILVSAILLAINSCSIFSPVEGDKVSHYFIKVDPVKVDKAYCVNSNSLAMNSILQITPTTALPPFSKSKMYYTDKLYNLETYAYHKWAASPQEMLQQSLQSSIMEACLYKDVVLSELETLPTKYRLTTRILNMKQIVNGKSSVVVLEVLAQYIDNNSNHLISSNIFRETSEQYADALGYVNGINQDSNRLISDIIKWLRVNTVSQPMLIKLNKEVSKKWQLK